MTLLARALVKFMELLVLLRALVDGVVDMQVVLPLFLFGEGLVQVVDAIFVALKAQQLVDRILQDPLPVKAPIASLLDPLLVCLGRREEPPQFAINILDLEGPRHVKGAAGHVKDFRLSFEALVSGLPDIMVELFYQIHGGIYLFSCLVKEDGR